MSVDERTHRESDGSDPHLVEGRPGERRDVRVAPARSDHLGKDQVQIVEVAGSQWPDHHAAPVASRGARLRSEVSEGVVHGRNLRVHPAASLWSQSVDRSCR